MSRKDTIWTELYDVRIKMRELFNSATKAGLRRDEAMTADDYVYHARECNRLLKEQCELGFRETQLHAQLCTVVDEEDSIKPIEPEIAGPTE